MAKTYWIGTYRSISNPEKLAAYAVLAGPAITAGGGKFIVRGTPAKTYEAGLNQRTVVIEFESLAQATARMTAQPTRPPSPRSVTEPNATSGWSRVCNYPTIYSHLNPSPHRFTYPRDGDGKCAKQHCVSVSQYCSRNFQRVAEL